MNRIIYIRVVVFGYATQQEFADELSINQSRLSRLERGERPSTAVSLLMVDLAAERGLDFDAALFFRDLTAAEQEHLDLKIESFKRSAA